MSNKLSHWQLRKLVALIFVFLLSVVYPLFDRPSIEIFGEFSAPGNDDQTVYLAIEEQAEVGMRVTQEGGVLFFNVQNGDLVKQFKLPIGAQNSIRSFEVIDEASGLLAAGLQTGEILFFRHKYRLEFTDTRRIIHPELEYPYGEAPFAVTAGPLLQFGIGANEESISLLGRSSNNEIINIHIKIS